MDEVQRCHADVFDDYADEDGVDVWLDLCMTPVNPDGTCPNAGNHWVGW